MSGGSLKDLLKTEGPLNQERTLEILQQIGSGLSYSHKRGVIHRDLKPGNILFDGEGKARVSDMGFAKLLGSDSSMSMSTSGGLVGTPAYMAPEIWSGQQATAATDVYSLACIFVEMLTGKPLFEGETTPVVMMKHFKPLELPDALLNEWKSLLEKALEKDPESRTAQINEFIKSLQHTYETHFAIITDMEQQEWSDLQRIPIQKRNNQTEAWEVEPEPDIDEKSSHFQETDDPYYELPDSQRPQYLSKMSQILIGLGLVVLLGIILIVRPGGFASKPEPTSGSQIVQVQGTATTKPAPTSTIAKSPTRSLETTATPVLPEESDIYHLDFFDSNLIIDSGYEMLTIQLDPIYATVFSPLGNYIGAIGDEGIYVLDADNFQTKANLGLDRTYTSISWSPDEKYIAGATDAGWINVWELSSGMIDNIWQASEFGEIFMIAYSPDGSSLVTAGINDPIYIWDPLDYNNKIGTQKLIVKEPTMWVPCVAWSPDGTKIASGSMDGIVRVWNSKTAVQLLEIEGHTDQVRNVVWSPDDKFIFSSGWDFSTSKWDATTGELVATTEESEAVRTMSISPDGDMLLLGYEGAAYSLRDADSLDELKMYYSNAKSNNATWSPEGDRFVVSDVEGAIWLVGYDHSEDSLESSELTRTSVSDALFNGLGLKLYSLNPDKPNERSSQNLHIYIQCFGCNSDDMLITDNTHQYDSMIWSPDGSLIGAVRDDTELVLIDPVGGTERSLSTGDISNRDLSWSPDGLEIAYRDLGALKGVEVANGSVRTIVKSSEIQSGYDSYPDVNDISWSPTGEYLGFWTRMSRNGGNDESGWTLWTVKEDGSDLTPYAPPDGYGYMGFAWVEGEDAFVFYRFTLDSADNRGPYELMMGELFTGEIKLRTTGYNTRRECYYPQIKSCSSSGFCGCYVWDRD